MRLGNLVLHAAECRGPQNGGGGNEYFELKSLIFCPQQILNYRSFIYSPTDALVSCLKNR